MLFFLFFLFSLTLLLLFELFLCLSLFFLTGALCAKKGNVLVEDKTVLCGLRLWLGLLACNFHYHVLATRAGFVIFSKSALIPS